MSISDMKPTIPSGIALSPTVVITETEYKGLLHDQLTLQCLYGAGVDNWEGYDDAMDMVRELNEEIEL